MGAITFVFGFAMIWYIWWLAIASLLAMIVAVIYRGSDDHTDYMLSAEEVARVEGGDSVAPSYNHASI